MDIYTHLDESGTQNAAEKLEQYYKINSSEGQMGVKDGNAEKTG